MILLISILVNIPAVQNMLVHQVTKRLSTKLGTRVEIKHINLRLFNSMRMEGTYIEDRHKDTLLYAGALQVRITDWFFFKETPVLKFIGLEDATVNLVRHKGDSLWNYAFIADAFAGPSASPKKKQQASFSVDLKNVDLQRVKFNFIDRWRGEDMYLYSNRILLDAQKLDLTGKNIWIQSLELDQPSFVISSYPASRPKRTTPLPATVAAPPDTGTVIPGLQWNPDRWNLLVRSLRIENGTFGVDNRRGDTLVPSDEGYFDPGHIRFEKINLSLSNTQFKDDSIFSDLKLRTRERSGFEVKQLDCRFKMSPVQMEFSNLDLRTENSQLGDYFAMEYSDFSDFADFVDAVTMRANFKKTRLSSDDIAYFAPALKDWNTEIRFSGSARGPVSNLRADSMSVQGGKATKLAGSFQMRGLPNIDETFIDFQATELITNGADLRQFLPILKTTTAVRTDLITHLRFQGSFSGLVNNFVAYGKFQTNLGNLDTDINFKTSGDVPVYSGNVLADNFNVGILLDNNIVSTVSMDAKVNGAGFNFQTLKAAVDANIRSIGLNNYLYQNIKTKGEMNRKFFNGSLNIADPNLDMDFAGTIDFNNALPIFDFDAEIRNSDLKALKLTKDSITLQAKADLNFAGSNIDNFDGMARLYDLSLLKNNSRVEFDSLVVRTDIENNQKALRIKGSEVDGYVTGNYSFMELPYAFQLFLNKYYPSYFKVPEGNPPAQDFRFAFQFGEVDKLIRAFNDDISGLNQTKVEGALNTATGSFTINAHVPFAQYDVYGVRDLVLKSNGDFNKINLSTQLGQVLYKDSTIFNNPLILASSSHDTSYVQIDMKAEDTTSLDGFYARVVTVKEGVKVNFLNSSFTVNNRQWQMEPGNEVYWSKDFLTVNNLRITRNNQSITIQTNEFNPDDSRFDIIIKDLNLADIIPPQLTTTRIEGLANGNIAVVDPFNHLTINTDLTTSQLRVANDSIGVVTIKGDYDIKQGLTGVEIKADNALADFLVQGNIGLTKDNKDLDVTIVANNSSISLLNQYLSDYVSNLTGYANGKIEIRGTTDKPSFTGNMRIDSVGVKVNYLGTYYRIPTLNVKNIDDAFIEMDPFQMIDKFGNTARANGFISHENFKNLRFEFDIFSPKFLFLNTTAADSDLYYGDILANARVYFEGPLDNLQLRVQARPLLGSHFYLPISDSKTIGKYEFISFKSYGKTEAVKKKKSNVKLNVRLDIAATPDAQIDVILDATTGDQISANGTGNLQLNVNLDGDFTMFGNYIINNGTYNFIFQRLARWKFDIQKNSTITWNGEPTEAKMNITAKYSLPKVSLYNLIDRGGGTQQTSTTDQLATRQEKVDININLRGALMQPVIDYSIELPDAGSLAYGSAVAAKLKEINQDQSKALLQVTALLAAGQFWSDEGLGGTASVSTTGKNSIGQALSAQASAILNNASSALLKNSGIGFNVNYTAYNFGLQESSYDRNLVSAGITKNLLNNRIRLYVGGNYDWGRQSANANSEHLAGDFRVEYLLTEDGRVRMNAFTRSDYDVYTLGNRNRGGVGISYVRDFNKVRELFHPVQRPRRPLPDSSRRREAIRQEVEDSLKQRQ
ncbi:translocation/assembly module TamB [Chitinophaga horti]|uniref:Translocation/assembly module TamB n=1 Tax=Chitinophaga horti TaxID=2920382 RepID=A0ABY6IV44_9BACT|nr:translocation/assembly module TamB [Chitinophaga horti]UYQ91093.1 translocation/assembly module TamB [Chitinophaga horti]